MDWQPKGFSEGSAIAQMAQASYKDIRSMIEAQQYGIAYTDNTVTVHSPIDNTDGTFLVFSTDDLECATKKELDKLNMLVRPYISTNGEYDMKKEKLDFDPKLIVYDHYRNEYDGADISEDEAREQLTDYFHHDENPLIFRDIVKHYHFAGPDPEKNPTKRKFYNCVPYYKSYYDGKYGQTTDVVLQNETDISAPIWQDLAVAMVLSYDFTLQQALFTVAHACNRCRHVLLKRYEEYLLDDKHKEEGYSETDPRFLTSNDRCQYCKHKFAHTLTLREVERLNDG